MESRIEINNFNIIEDNLEDLKRIPISKREQSYFYLVVVMKRNKDNPNKGIKYCNYIKYYEVQNKEDLEKRKEEIKKLSTDNNARVYISMNKRKLRNSLNMAKYNIVTNANKYSNFPSFCQTDSVLNNLVCQAKTKAGLDSVDKSAINIQNIENYNIDIEPIKAHLKKNYPQGTWESEWRKEFIKSCADSYKNPALQKYFPKCMIDIDTQDTNIHQQVLNMISNITTTHILFKYKTPNGGMHILLDNREVESLKSNFKSFGKDKLKYDIVSIDIDALSLLYANIIPAGYSL